jgi:hypothetical protein
VLHRSINPNLLAAAIDATGAEDRDSQGRQTR